MRLALLALALAATSAAAQPVPADSAALDSVATPLVGEPLAEQTAAEVRQTLDARWQRAIYGVEHPAVAALLRGVNYSADPVFLGTAPALGLVGLAEGDFRAAAATGLAQVGTTGLVFALKALVRRPRPFVALDGVEPWHGSGAQPDSTELFDPHSFPSGHTAIAFTLAASLSLAYPEWYVAAPAFTWAVLASLARPWLGMHYPSDLAVGALIGGGMAVGAHLLVDALFPAPDGDPLAHASGPTFRIGLSF